MILSAWNCAKAAAFEARKLYLQTLQLYGFKTKTNKTFTITDEPQFNEPTDEGNKYQHFINTDNDLTSLTGEVPQQFLTSTIMPELFGDSLVTVTASDGGRKPVFGSHRHAYSGAFSPNSPLNFCNIMKGPQNITLAEIFGVCQTLIRTSYVDNFTDEQPHVHVTDSMNTHVFLSDLQSAARAGREELDPLYVSMLCIPDFYADLMTIVSILKTRKRLVFYWVESHTTKTSVPHRMNAIADKLCHTALANYYQILPPIGLIEEERLKFNCLPQAVRDLY